MTHPEMCRKLEILGFRFQRQAVDPTRSGLIRQTGGGPPSPGTGTGDRGHRHPSPNSQKPGNLQRPTDLRLSQDPPITSLRLEVTGNKAKRGREVPIPDDLVESLGDLASIHAKDRTRPLFDVTRQWVSKSMKEAALEAGLDPARAHPHALRHTYGRKTPFSTGFPRRCSSSVWDTIPWRRRSGTCSSPADTTTG